MYNDRILQIVGPSGSGKTIFTLNLIKNRDHIFKNKIKNIYWHYGAEENDDTLKLSNKVKGIKYIKGLPENFSLKLKKYDMLVVDDLFVEGSRSSELTNMFTKIARHSKVFTVFITQNLFHQGKDNRTRNLNVHYLALFKNPRDSMTIDFLARQMYGPGKGRQFLLQSFNDATKNKPHSYLFFDFTQECSDNLRIKSDIFNPSGVTIYKQTSDMDSDSDNG